MKKLIFTGLAGMVAGVSVAEKPNILLVFTDQQTATAMSCAGNEYLNTPTMDKLAEDGVRFTNAYCAAPLSGPSRFAMMTGITPGTHKMLKNNAPFPSDVNKKETLGYLMADAGYDCAYGGKWHIPEASLQADDEGKGWGFTVLHPHKDYGLAESCTDFLKQSRDKPFFLVAAFDNPHNICEYARHQVLPFATIEEPEIGACPNLPDNFYPAPYEAGIIRLEQTVHYPTYPVINYTPDDWRRYLNAYYRLTEHVDAEIGKIINTLKELRLYDNTVIIFTSDHGDGIAANQWNQKSALFEEIVNIPFLVKETAKSKNKKVVYEQLINMGIDVLPTICDYAGAEVPKSSKGKSVKKLLDASKKEEIHSFIVTETQFDKSPTRGWMVRTPDYKYVLYDKGKYREQLFEIKKDKKERRNLAIEDSYRDVLNEHRKLLNVWIKDNGIVTTGREIIPNE